MSATPIFFSPAQHHLHCIEPNLCKAMVWLSKDFFAIHNISGFSVLQSENLHIFLLWWKFFLRKRKKNFIQHSVVVVIHWVNNLCKLPWNNWIISLKFWEFREKGNNKNSPFFSHGFLSFKEWVKRVNTEKKKKMKKSEKNLHFRSKMISEYGNILQSGNISLIYLAMKS